MQCSQQPQLQLVAAGKLIPHIKKVDAGGDDAFFVSTAGLGALGVADGVSAWQEDGPTVAGDYARALISHCAETFEQAPTAAAAVAPNAAAHDTNTDSSASAAAAAVIPDPADVMAAAQHSTRQAGSAPLLLAALQPGAKLQVANIGDCRMLLLRGGCVVGETEQQVHGAAEANAPYQLSHPDCAKPGQLADTAQDAERYTWEVQEGDLLIAGTDGLFDNLFIRDMLPLAHQALCGYTNAAEQPTTSSSSSSSSSARRSTGGGWDTGASAPSAADASDGAAACIEAEYTQAAVSYAAELLAAAAAKNAASRWARVPAAQPAGGCLLPWLMSLGGKMDDITCVVALVTKRGAQPGSSSAAAATTAAAAAAVEEGGGEAEAVFQDCIEQHEGINRSSSSAAVSMHSCLSQDDDAAAAAPATGTEALPAAGTQQEDLAVPAAAAAAAAIGDAAAEKENAHSSALTAAAAAAESPRAASFRGQWALPAMHVVRQSNNKLSSARSDASSTSSYSRPGSSASSRSYSVSYVPGATSTAAAGSSRPSSATGSYSSASDRSVPPIKVTRVSSSASAQLRMMPKSSGSTSGSTAGSVAGSTSGGYYWRAPKLGESPTHVKREAARRHTTSARMLAPSAAAAAGGGDGDGRVSSSGGSKLDNLVDSASLQQQMQLREPKAAAAAAAENVEPKEQVPAGKDSTGKQLYVGSCVAVTTELGVAAVGRVKLLPGQKVDKWMEDKVWPEHLGIGDIRVSRDMQKVAQQAKFWVKCEGHGLYGNHPAYTFWSKRQQLQEKRVCVSIPCSSLKLIE